MRQIYKKMVRYVGVGDNIDIHAYTMEHPIHYPKWGGPLDKLL